MNRTSREVLRYLEESGKIDMDAVEKEMKEKENEKLLAEHPYAISHIDDPRFPDGRWKTYIKDKSRPNNRRPIVRVRYEDLISALLKHYHMEIAPQTMESILKEYLDDKRRVAQDVTVARDKRAWNRYLAGTEIVKKPIDDLTGDDLKIWLEDLIDKEQLTKHQYTNVKTIINQILDYAVYKKYILVSPIAGIKINKNKMRPEHKKPGKTQRFLDDEVQRIKALAWDDYYKRRHRIHQLVPLALIFMFCTGIRIGEACAVKWSDIEDRVIIIQRILSGETHEIKEHVKMGNKGFGDRPIPLIEEARSVLEAAKERQIQAGVYSEDGYIFSMQPGKPCPYSALAKCFYTYCKKLGITPKSSHKARKTFGSTMLDAGVSVEIVRKLLGHLREETTYGSYHFDATNDDEKENVIESSLSGQQVEVD